MVNEIITERKLVKIMLISSKKLLHKCLQTKIMINFTIIVILIHVYYYSIDEIPQ